MFDTSNTFELDDTTGDAKFTAEVEIGSALVIDKSHKLKLTASSDTLYSDKTKLYMNKTSEITLGHQGNNITEEGEGYTDASDVQLSGGNGYGAKVNIIAGGPVDTGQVTGPGTSGYVTANDLLVSGGNGNDLNLNIIASGGQVVSATIADSGEEYAAGDEVTILQNGSTNDALFEIETINNFEAKVISASISDGGSGYAIGNVLEIMQQGAVTPAEITVTSLGNDSDLEGAGLILEGQTNKTILWNETISAWDISPDLHVSGDIECSDITATTYDGNVHKADGDFELSSGGDVILQSEDNISLEVGANNNVEIQLSGGKVEIKDETTDYSQPQLHLTATDNQTGTCPILQFNNSADTSAQNCGRIDFVSYDDGANPRMYGTIVSRILDGAAPGAGYIDLGVKTPASDTNVTALRVSASDVSGSTDVLLGNNPSSVTSINGVLENTAGDARYLPINRTYGIMTILG